MRLQSCCAYIFFFTTIFLVSFTPNTLAVPPAVPPAVAAVLAVGAVYKFVQVLNELKQTFDNVKEIIGHDVEEERITPADLKMFVDQLKRDIHNLDHSIVINHFNTNVKYPMKKVFNEVRRILAEPTNITKRALEVQCLAEPPLTTLEILKDNLEDNWFIKMAEHYHYYSPEVEKIEQRLDKYVEILAICQAACSGLHGGLEAKYDFRSLKNIHEAIRKEYLRSKDFILKTYFQYSKNTIKNFFPDTTMINNSKEIMNFQIVSNLLQHYEINYNYGSSYIIKVDQRLDGILNNSAKKMFLFNHGKYSVIVVQSGRISDTSHFNNTVKYISNYLDTCLSNPTDESQGNISCWRDFTPVNAVYGSNGEVFCIKGYKKCEIIYPNYYPSKEFHSLRAENHWFYHWRGNQIMDKHYWPVKSGPLREGNPYIVKKFFIDTTLILNENEIVKNRTEYKIVASATNVTAAVTVSTLPSIPNTNYFTAEKNELEKWGLKIKSTVKSVFQDIVALFNF